MTQPLAVVSRNWSLPPKQTRVNVQQSKKGCVTCRCVCPELCQGIAQVLMHTYSTRRVKCDEKRPKCIKCEAAGKTCGGYEHNSNADTVVRRSRSRQATETTVEVPEADPAASLCTDAASSSYFQLGLTLLGCFEPRYHSAASIVWIDLLPRLSKSSQSIYAASTALGAVYEAFSIQNPLRSGGHLAASSAYQAALTHLKTGIQLRLENPVALFLTTLILAGVEALQRNLTNGLMHVRGAFKIHAECIAGVPATDLSQFVKDGISDDEVAALSLLVRLMDLQVMMYKLSLSNQLPLVRRHSHTDTTKCLSTKTKTELDVISLLHDCYAFSSSAAAYKYVPHSGIPPEVIEQQSHYSSLLHQQLINDIGDLLRLQCLSALIYISSIFSPQETSFDSCQNLFQQIVGSSAHCLGDRSDSSAHLKLRFRLVSDISQPVFLTAMKCRNPALRRKAVELLRLTGKEGPWDSRVLVAVATRAIEIEESLIPDRKDGSPVPERARLHGCGMGHISTDTGAPVDGAIPNTDDDDGRRIIEFRFRRCNDVEGFVTARGSQKTVEELDPKYWEIWNERIEVI